MIAQSLQRLDGIPDAFPVACLAALAPEGIPNRKGTFSLCYDDPAPGQG